MILDKKSTVPPQNRSKEEIPAGFFSAFSAKDGSYGYTCSFVGCRSNTNALVSSTGPLINLHEKPSRNIAVSRSVPQPVVQYGPVNKEHLIWASLRILLGRHLQTNLILGYYIGFSVDFTAEPFFLSQFSCVLQQASIIFLLDTFLQATYTVGYI